MFSLRNRAGEAPQVSREDVTEARSQHWWGEIDDLAQRPVSGNTPRDGLHRVGAGQERDGVHGACVRDVDAPAPELQRVDGVSTEESGDARRQHEREHQGQDDLVVVGQLEDDEHRGDRHARSRGEHRAQSEVRAKGGSDRKAAEPDTARPMTFAATDASTKVRLGSAGQ